MWKIESESPYFYHPVLITVMSWHFTYLLRIILLSYIKMWLWFNNCASFLRKSDVHTIIDLEIFLAQKKNLDNLSVWYIKQFVR